MTAVVSNRTLFNALLSCLSGADIETEGTCNSNRPMMHHHIPGVVPGAPGVGRKRTASFAEMPLESMASKSLKVAHSPNVSRRTFTMASKPQFNVKTLAGTIIFTAFENLDHWPAPLVKAYADDCFGPRAWVDDPACKLLVQNLALVHTVEDGYMGESSTQSDEVDERAAEALMVAEFYRIEDSVDGGSSRQASPVPTDRRRLSTSSFSSTLSVPPLAPPTRMRSSSIGSTDMFPERSSKPGAATTPVASPSTPTKSSMSAERPEKRPPLDDDDSDSGDDEEVIVATKGQQSTKKRSSSDDGSSSSSGEEDEEVVVTSKSFEEESLRQDLTGSPGKAGSRNRPSPTTSQTSSTNNNYSSLSIPYPIRQKNLNLERVRQRYFGVNLEYAQHAISTSLSDRLDVKSKQNSGLLQSLPSFTSIPSIRALVTANLEKWLQSPALSGLARSLFSTTVKMMKNIDPPLPADLRAIDNILGMRLKANQLNAHIENVTAIATRIPTAAVSHHIYIHLLREVVMTMDTGDSMTSDHLKMVGAVHSALPSAMSSEGIAAALLTLLVNPPGQIVSIGRDQLVKKLASLIRAIAGELGPTFDGCQLLQSLLDFNVDSDMWSVGDEVNKGRLMHQCVTLLVPPAMSGFERSQNQPPSRCNVSEDDFKLFKQNLMRCRKLLLIWCCRDFAPMSQKSDSPPSGRKKDKGEEVGAGLPDYNSILDGIDDSATPSWLLVMRSVLFMEDADSPHLSSFLSPGSTSAQIDVDWQHEAKRIQLCCQHGTDLDDEMVWIILKNSDRIGKMGISCGSALRLLEHLFEYCNEKSKSSLLLTDPNLIWALYKLVEYVPMKPKQLDGDDVEMVDANGSGDDGNQKRNGIKSGVGGSKREIPRLAYPGMWWRVTGLALVMCGASPDRIGEAAWNEHPTLRALIKMVTSNRYRFPTVDCDEASREEMKRTEQTMRDEEARITELLFMPKQSKKKSKPVKVQLPNLGSRASKRQRDKRERLLQKQREIEAAEALAEANRRKKIMRSAQKSIMLWDPRRGPRKPPKESADLLFSVGELFALPQVFQRSVNPDFALMTIGKTTRGAIERAYDWLIPIISYLPDTIGRLPASASCFLLLRAYGTEGEERAQLQELSAPLLAHVRDSLKGRFGEADAVRAFDLLLTDVASHNPDRRRCARRVLHDAIGEEEFSSRDTGTSNVNSSWMTNILKVDHVDAIIGDAIKQMSRAASFERGETLRSLILSLEGHMAFAKEKGIPGTYDFPSMFIGLLSSRPAVFAETMGAFPDLRYLAIRVVRNEFDLYVNMSTDRDLMDIDSAVVISLGQHEKSESDDRAMDVKLPLSLLQSACVLLSIWREEEESEQDTTQLCKRHSEEAANAVDDLVSMLLRDGGDDNGEEPTAGQGLSSAHIADSGNIAVQVESWVMLARSCSDFIARRAALTAPTGFLPRMLLCSGLPRASLLTMIDRLGQLGDKSQDKAKTFSQLLVPSASSEWDIGRLGHRREVSRKLLGRLSAYTRMYHVASLEGEEKVSSTFLEWLADSCRNVEKPRKQKSKKPKIQSTTSALQSHEAATSILSVLSDEIVEPSQRTFQMDGDASDMTEFVSSNRPETIPHPKLCDGIDKVKGFVEAMYEKNQPDVLRVWLNEIFAEDLPFKAFRGKRVEVTERAEQVEVALHLLHCHMKLEERRLQLASLLLKWVPLLSRSEGSIQLWKVLFDKETSFPYSFLDALLSECMQVWSWSHVLSCRNWILSHKSSDTLRLDHVVRFLLNTSTQPSVHIERFAMTSNSQNYSEFGKSEEFVSTSANLALDCLEQEPKEIIEHAICNRNHLPDCLLLLLLLSGCGRKQVQLVSQTIVRRIEKAEEGRNLLLAVILRLYAYFPFFMNLGVAILRSVLKEAVEEYAQEWLAWRSPFDDRFQDILDSILTRNAPTRLVQALLEHSKKHPLLLLRKLGVMTDALEKDGLVDDSSNTEMRGVISGQNVNGPQLAKVGGKLMKVTVKHWGYNYTENVWIAFLDVISAGM